MKILKHAENSELFLLDEITDEQIIALKDIATNYKAYLLTIIKMSDKQMAEFAPGNPVKARESMRLQIKTCMAYEIAFNDIISAGEPKKPLQN
jgi:hypothetical protein